MDGETKCEPPPEHKQPAPGHEEGPKPPKRVERWRDYNLGRLGTSLEEPMEVAGEKRVQAEGAPSVTHTQMGSWKTDGRMDGRMEPCDPDE